MILQNFYPHATVDLQLFLEFSPLTPPTKTQSQGSYVLGRALPLSYTLYSSFVCSLELITFS